MPTYDPKWIEPKWQDYWLRNRTFRAVDGADKPKYYVLDMFPYPSSDGLHVGHPEGYTATDILARYQRMRGRNVLHPMGWDAFGLPAEQHAVEKGVHPAVTTACNVANFRRQIRMLGFSYDWDREIDTTDPSYYKWTQWIFRKLYESWYDAAAERARPIAELPIPAEVEAAGAAAVRRYQDERRLAYVAQAPVNWCPALGTVLANEEVIDGKSERGGHPVVRVPLRQWMLRITAYAERLLRDLELVEWPEAIKEMQRNWIGRSEGAEVDFLLCPGENSFDPDRWLAARAQGGFPERADPDVIRVYTTRPDTLFGATYMVLAPEHPLVDRVTTPERRAEVAEYQEQAARKSDLDRTDLARQKTGVFTGAYALNPVNLQQIPVWIADYVLMGYGTGAIMAVPAHDERDFEFAQKYDLEIVAVVAAPADAPPLIRQAYQWMGEWERQKGPNDRDRYLKVAVLINAGFDLESFEADLDEYRDDPFWQGVRVHRDPEGAGLAIAFLDSGFSDLLAEYIDAHEDSLVLLFTLDKNIGLARTDELGDSFDQTEFFAEDFDQGDFDPEDEPSDWPRAFTGDGISVQSGIITGLETPAAKVTITQWLSARGLGRKTVNYKLRDWLFSRQRYWGEPFPILLDTQGGHRPLDESELPLVLPDLADFKPTGTPDPPLSKAPADWLVVERDGQTYTRETNTMPQWAGSCWYYLRFIDPKNPDCLVDPAKERYWMPVDLYVGGAEHAVLHLLYARFWHKVLYDWGVVHTPEPFRRLVNQGMILGEMEYTGYTAGGDWVSIDDVEDDPAGGAKVQRSTGRPVQAVALKEDQTAKVQDRWVLAADPAIRIDARIYKMSKSRGNVINPDAVVTDYGADSLRLYEMFMGPLEAAKPWSTTGVDGVRRFLNRVWRLIVDERADDLRCAPNVTDDQPLRDDLRVLHQTIRDVTNDLDGLRFNTAISKLMELTNHLTRLERRPRALLEPVVLLLSPMAPHVAEELWQVLGHTDTLAYEPWPSYDQELVRAEELEVAIQVNNRVRAKLLVPADIADSELIRQAETDERIVAFLANRPIAKSFVVNSRKGKLVNLVVKE